MANGIYIYVQNDNTRTALQRKLATLLNDEETRLGINEILLECINKYVPEGETGELRSTAYATAENIVWSKEYAHYQFIGTVYGPNFRVVDPETGMLTWKSPKGKGSKYPTFRPLGWYNGYSTPGTGPDWANEMWRNERRQTNLRITNYMKRRVKELDL